MSRPLAKHVERNLKNFLNDYFYSELDARHPDKPPRGAYLMQQHIRVVSCGATLSIFVSGLDAEDALISAQDLPNAVDLFLQSYKRDDAHLAVSRCGDVFIARRCAAYRQQSLCLEADDTQLAARGV